MNSKASYLDRKTARPEISMKNSKAIDLYRRTARPEASTEEQQGRRSTQKISKAWDPSWEVLQSLRSRWRTAKPYVSTKNSKAWDSSWEVLQSLRSVQQSLKPFSTASLLIAAGSEKTRGFVSEYSKHLGPLLEYSKPLSFPPIQNVLLGQLNTIVVT